MSKKQQERWVVNPFQLDQVCCVREDGWPLEVVARVLFNGDENTSIHRGRLIAAAPELLEFAQWILTLRTGGMIEGRARAAIEKATGENQ